MSLTRKVAYNTIAQAVGKILYLGCSLVIVILITRHLGVSGYGNYNTIIAYLGLFAVLAELGLYMIMVREISQYPKEKEKIVGNILGLRIFTAIAALILATVVAFFLNYPQEVKTGILIFSGGIFFMLLNQVLVGVFQVYLRADKAALAEVVGRAFTLILVIWFIKQGAGLLYIVGAASLGFALNFFINFLLASQYLKIIPQFQTSLWKKLLKAALPLAIAGILWTIYYKIDTVILSLLPLERVAIESISHFSNSEAVGIYGVAYRFLEIVIAFPILFVGLIYPVISKNIILNRQRTKRVFQKSFNFLTISSLLFMLIGFFLAPQIIDIVGGSQFTQSVLVLRILSISFLPHFWGALTGIVLTAAHKQKFLIIPVLTFTIVNIAANIIFIPYYSFLGSATITTLGQFLLCIIYYYLIRKHTSLVPSFNILPKALLAGVGTAGLLILGQRSSFVFWQSAFYDLPIWQEFLLTSGVILILLIIYFFLLYLFRGIRKEDLLALRR